MDAKFLVAARAELATLKRRVSAIEAMLAAYSDEDGNAGQPAEAPAKPLAAKSSRRAAGPDRFSTYGESIISAAVAALSETDGSPVPTRDMVALVESRGVEVRGADKVNALSALLSRSSAIQSNGRRGWTLAADTGEGDTENARTDMNQAHHGADNLGRDAHKENEPNSDEAVGSDAADEDVAASPSAMVHSNWGPPT